MKQKLSLFLAIIVSFVIASGFTVIPTQPNSESTKSVKKIITDRWIIDNYSISDEDNTELYKEYDFTFYEDGTVSVGSSSESYSGFYTDDAEMIGFQFESYNALTKLNVKWIVKERTEDVMVLGDEYGRVLSFKRL